MGFRVVEHGIELDHTNYRNASICVDSQRMNVLALLCAVKCVAQLRRKVRESPIAMAHRSGERTETDSTS